MKFVLSYRILADLLPEALVKNSKLQSKPLNLKWIVENRLTVISRLTSIGAKDSHGLWEIVGYTPDMKPVFALHERFLRSDVVWKNSVNHTYALAHLIRAKKVLQL